MHTPESAAAIKRRQIVQYRLDASVISDLLLLAMDRIGRNSQGAGDVCGHIQCDDDRPDDDIAIELPAPFDDALSEWQ
jgi:hypothetical protein